MRLRNNHAIAPAMMVGLIVLSAQSFGQSVAVIDNTSSSGLQGVVYFNGALQLQGTFTTANVLNGIAFEGSSNQNVYCSTTAGVSEFDSSGAVLHNYNNVGTDSFGSVAVDGSGNVWAVDNTTGGLFGVVKFDSSLNVLDTFLFGGPILGISVGSGGSLYMTTATHVYHTDLVGNVTSQYNGIGSDSFLGSSFNGTKEYVADNASGVQGVLVFDPTLGSFTPFLTPNPITGLAADAGGTVYTSQGINILSYDSSGNLQNTFNGVGVDLFYGVAVQPKAVPEPATFAVFGLGALIMVRRRRASRS